MGSASTDPRASTVRNRRLPHCLKTLRRSCNATNADRPRAALGRNARLRPLGFFCAAFEAADAVLFDERRESSLASHLSPGRRGTGRACVLRLEGTIALACLLPVESSQDGSTLAADRQTSGAGRGGLNSSRGEVLSSAPARLTVQPSVYARARLDGSSGLVLVEAALACQALSRSTVMRVQRAATAARSREPRSSFSPYCALCMLTTR
jgi:hypothetical protein